MRKTQTVQDDREPPRSRLGAESRGEIGEASRVQGSRNSSSRRSVHPELVSKPDGHEPRDRFVNLGIMLIDRREQVLQIDSKNAREVEKLKVAYPNEPRLDFRDCASSHIPTNQLQFNRQHVLRPTLLVA